jgi:hypothetical protein
LRAALAEWSPADIAELTWPLGKLTAGEPR